MNNDQLYFYNRGFNDCLAKFLDTPPAKTLTDDEIEKVFWEIATQEKIDNPVMEFARAILKKASEK